MLLKSIRSHHLAPLAVFGLLPSCAENDFKISGTSDVAVSSTGDTAAEQGTPTDGNLNCSAPQTLKEAGACVGVRKGGAGIRIGAAVSNRHLQGNAPYRDLLVREFNALTPENEMKWGPLQPERGAWAFDTADTMVDFALEQGLTVRGHTLVWYSQAPPWLNSIDSPEDMRAAMQEHIYATLEHYRGRVELWDVVNEAVADGPQSGGSWLRNWSVPNALGVEYIADAFRMAREADPAIKLYYNDYNTETEGEKANHAYEIVKSLVDQGVPIDGVGFQMHINATPSQQTPSGGFYTRYPGFYNAEAFAANVDRYGELGLTVNISELDVRVRSPFDAPSVPQGHPPRDTAPITPAEDELQAKVYYEFVSVCVRKYPVCDGVTVWGVADPFSWYASDPVLPFDAEYMPKGAYDAIMAALLERPFY